MLSSGEWVEVLENCSTVNMVFKRMKSVGWLCRLKIGAIIRVSILYKYSKLIYSLFLTLQITRIAISIVFWGGGRGWWGGFQKKKKGLVSKGKAIDVIFHLP